uniref:Uncharacterized protein n=1 Tax=Eutreptiella gymnastica TaxID=73025 RepID=A0A7S4GKC0_9EUGL
MRHVSLRVAPGTHPTGTQDAPGGTQHAHNTHMICARQSCGHPADLNTVALTSVRLNTSSRQQTITIKEQFKPNNGKHSGNKEMEPLNALPLKDTEASRWWFLYKGW